ncbi:trichohyalin [Nasonia vitripennis]|uniref:Uncharacterized protein n=1 Tax=Nasonia vitripennis TaxID=7425 RepID=A0A7M7GKH4_NASVI|nr:trichohyalin [Nasonia vitripennis]
MVQNFIEPFNVDVIKVTIKDKPGLPRQTSEESLRTIFQALRQHAQQEGRIRELRLAIEKKTSSRTLKRYFDVWYNRAMTMRKIADSRLDVKTLNERKIELLVSAIAEKQKEIIAINEKRDNPLKRSSKSKSAPPAVINKKTQVKGVRAKSNDVPTNKACVQNRLQVQKVIIEEQRAKLAEQSKRIQDMKLKEIDKETKETSKQTISVAKKALTQCDQRTRRSIIHLMREEGCRDETLTEIPRIPSPPRFLMRMEARAEARKQRLKQAEEIRQRKREEEKKKEEMNRRKAEEEERLQQIQAMKNIKKIRKEQEERRLKEIQKNQHMEYLADRCYRRYLFRRYVLEPLNKLVEERYKRLQRADQHYVETILTKTFLAWKEEWMEQQKAKLELANKMHRHNLLWYAFDDWKTFALSIKLKYQVATDFSDMKIQAKYVKVWQALCAELRKKMKEKEAVAIKRHEDRLKLIYFTMWKQYTSMSEDIKEREQRRDEWRDLIKKFIPDSPSPKRSLDIAS